MDDNKTLIKKIIDFPQFSILLSFIVMILFFSLFAEGFFTIRNLMGVLRQSVIQMCVAIGMTFVLISNEIDLSVGSVANLSGTVMVGLMVKKGLNPLLAIAIGLFLGVLLGSITGMIVAFIKVPSFVVTLSMMISARGLSLVYSKARPINVISESVLAAGRGFWLGIPIPVIIAAVLVLLAAFTLSKTNYGRHIFAVGGNAESARLSGIHIGKIKISVFAISGFCAALAGMVMIMRLASSQPTMGDGLELDAIASAVLGGTSISGGKGYVLGTVIGGLFLVFLTNGFNIFGLSSFWQQVLKGIVLVLAVSLYEGRK